MRGPKRRRVSLPTGRGGLQRGRQARRRGPSPPRTSRGRDPREDRHAQRRDRPRHGDRRPHPTARGRAVPDRRWPLYRRHRRARAGLRALPALGRGARPDRRDRHAGRRGDARRGPDLHRQGPGGGRRHPLRLADHEPRRRGHAGAQAPHPRRGQGAPCRRPDCRRGGRDPRPGARRRRGDRPGPRGPARRRRHARGRGARCPEGPRRSDVERLLRLGLRRGEPRGRRPGDPGRGPRHDAGAGEQPPRRQPDRAPRGGGRLRPPPRTTRRSTPPRRTRTLSAS